MESLGQGTQIKSRNEQAVWLEMSYLFFLVKAGGPEEYLSPL